MAADISSNSSSSSNSNGSSGNCNSSSSGSRLPKPRGRRKKIRTEPIRPICPQCEKQFSNQSALTKHKLTHSDERKFACQQCSKAFKRHDHLTGHMQTHSNRKPFNCTIQGCDKTYCDARSLRRHKENIHHIVTPKDSSSSSSNNNLSNSTNHVDNNNNNASTSASLVALSGGGGGCAGGAGGMGERATKPTAQITATGYHQADCGQPLVNHHHNQQAPFSADYASTQHFSFATPMAPRNHFNEPQQVVQEPQQQRTGSNSANIIANNHMPPQHTHYQPNLNHHHNNNHHPHHHHHLNHHLNHNHQQASFSADYASTQHFSFEFDHVIYSDNNIDQPVNTSNTTIPHSADSGLGLNLHYEQQQPSNHFNESQQIVQEPQLPSTVSSTANIIANNHVQQPQQHTHYQPNINQHHHHQPASFSADYASTQHFSFEFDHVIQSDNNNNNIQQQTIPHSADSIASNHMPQQPQQQQQQQQQQQHTHYQPSINQHHPHQQASFSADYASTQHFSFEFDQVIQSDNNMEQHTIPHSADSIANNQQVAYTTFQPPTALQQQQQPSHLLKRRIQRLQTDRSDSNSSGDDQTRFLWSGPPNLMLIE